MMKTTLAHSKTKQEGSESLTEEVLDFAEGIGIIKSFNMLGEKPKVFPLSLRKVVGKVLILRKVMGLGREPYTLPTGLVPPSCLL